MPEAHGTPAPPRLALPWLLALLVTVVWWPIRTYWLSDDWIAVHHAADSSRAWSSFFGNQYGLAGLAWFYRPLLTMAFWLETAVAGTDPFLSHLDNAIAQGITAMLLGMLVCRFFGAAVGWWTALVWGTSPVHASSVLWAVGRSDTFTMMWVMLTAVLAVRWCDGAPRARIAALVSFVVALLCKEHAAIAPAIVALLCFVLAPAGRRLRSAVAGSLPFFAVLVVYIVWRRMMLGHALGGYATWTLDPFAVPRGLGTWTLRVLDPLIGLSAAGLERQGLPQSLLAAWWVGLLPPAAGVLILLRTRPAALPCLAILYLCIVAPLMQMWTYTDNPLILRNFGFPFAALAVLAAAGRAWTAVPALLCALLPHLEVRADYLESFDRSRRVHETLLEAAEHLPRGPVFVLGLPHQHEKLDTVEYHVGVDRILAPPFGAGHRVFALRPLVGQGGQLLPYGLAEGLPEGPTLSLRTAHPRCLPPTSLPRIETRFDGPTDLTAAVLEHLRAKTIDPAFVAGPPRADHYRITLLSASGYFGAILPNEDAPETPGGRVRLRSWLGASLIPSVSVGAEMAIPLSLDLEARFPVLIEGGATTTTAAGPMFQPTCVASALVWLTFDRDYTLLSP